MNEETTETTIKQCPESGKELDETTCSLPLTDRQIKIALNAVHERGMRLLDVWGDAFQKDFRKPDGKPLTKEELDKLHAVHLEHLELVEAIRKIRAETRLALAPPETTRKIYETKYKHRNMKDIGIKNAVIESAEITMEEHGTLDCWLHLDFGGTGQGFGGYALYLPKSFSHHQVLSVAGHHLFRIMEIAGVEKWSQLKGKTIRVEGSWSKIERIGHIVKDDWYCPRADFKVALDSPANDPVELPPNGSSESSSSAVDG